MNYSFALLAAFVFTMPTAWSQDTRRGETEISPRNERQILRVTALDVYVFEAAQAIERGDYSLAEASLFQSFPNTSEAVSIYKEGLAQGTDRKVLAERVLEAPTPSACSERENVYYEKILKGFAAADLGIYDYTQSVISVLTELVIAEYPFDARREIARILLNARIGRTETAKTIAHRQLPRILRPPLFVRYSDQDPLTGERLSPAASAEAAAVSLSQDELLDFAGISERVDDLVGSSIRIKVDGKDAAVYLGTITGMVIPGPVSTLQKVKLFFTWGDQSAYLEYDHTSPLNLRTWKMVGPQSGMPLQIREFTIRFR